MLVCYVIVAQSIHDGSQTMLSHIPHYRYI